MASSQYCAVTWNFSRSVTRVAQVEGFLQVISGYAGLIQIGVTNPLTGIRHGEVRVELDGAFRERNGVGISLFVSNSRCGGASGAGLCVGGRCSSRPTTCGRLRRCGDVYFGLCASAKTFFQIVRIS